MKKITLEAVIHTECVFLYVVIFKLREIQKKMW